MTLTPATSLTATTTMTDQERMDLVDRHASVEMVQDWDATWDTLDPEGSYDYFPHGHPDQRTRGDAGALASPLRSPGAQGRRRDDAEPLDPWGDVVLVTQAPVHLPDGEVRYSTSTAAFTFRGDKIDRESVFADDLLQPLLEQVFDEEFMALPGVSRIPTF